MDWRDLQPVLLYLQENNDHGAVPGMLGENNVAVHQYYSNFILVFAYRNIKTCIPESVTHIFIYIVLFLVERDTTSSLQQTHIG